jgi:methionyl-tRNA synthetase
LIKAGKIAIYLPPLYLPPRRFGGKKMSKKGPYYITTAIAYTSRKPHIGNSYEMVLTDAIARYRRMQGYDVFFLTGTDEHGQKIEDIAKEENISPKEYVDKIAGEIIGIAKLLNISYDGFIRTTDGYHEKAVQKIFKKLYDQGDIYKSSYSGMYCTPCESFWTESQLADGKCPDCGRKVERAEEEAYFLRLSAYQKRLEDFLEQNPDFIYPEARKKEMVNNFIKPGLQDLCVSRTSFTWGIPVDFDPGHIVYVWIDALSNYITALGYDPDGSSGQYKKYWPADVHIIGKDILRFHTIYWPIILMALGEPLPKQVFGHPWMLFGEDKMSKSRGNVIYADDLVGLIGVDAVRYYLLSEMPYVADGSITYETVVERFNSDLANVLGNLVNRTVAMSNRYFDGEIPAPSEAEPADGELSALALDTARSLDKYMEEFRISDLMNSIFTLARRSNKYIDETTPWILARDEAKKARLGTVLYNLLESIRFLGTMLTPFLPDTGAEILRQIGAGSADFDSLAAFGGLKPGGRVGTATPLFNRIDQEKFLSGLVKGNEASQEPEVKIEGVAQIGIDDFCKVELRVAEVTACEPVKRAKKLLKLTLNDGEGGRTVVSGIAQHYTPEELTGRKIILVANLQPATLCGVESRGMILAATCPDGAVKVVFMDSSVPAGSKIS